MNENKDPLELDFVYGYTKDSISNSEEGPKSFIPLDGQQRLTTLFLLHWYIAVKESHLDEAKIFLSNFTYETRHSSRVFCNKLVEFVPEILNIPIKDTIINQPWFFNAWINDPTINSMLTMLNAIQEKVIQCDLQNVWPLLTSEQPKIVFYLLPMDKLGLPDDLYIKMNSRGKELTEFEYFKSQFSEILPKRLFEEFNNKVDQSWSDLFWNLYKEETDVDIANKVDNGFIRYFQYITDIMVHKNNIDIESLNGDFDIYKAVYADDRNIKFLFNSLDSFYSTFSTNPSLFDNLFYIEEVDFNVNKSRLFFQNAKISLLKNCADNYDVTQRSNPFSIGEQLLLYACIEHLINKTDYFNPRIRIVRNLISNSEDTVRKENMPFLLKTISEIIINNYIDEDSKFNKKQIEEELFKQSFIENNRELKDTIYKIEDHSLLQGCLAIFNFDTNLANYSKAFSKIFTSDNKYDIISRALLCFGDYSQKYNWRRRFGNRNDSVWRELLTPSQRRGDFQNTKDVLYSLMTQLLENPQCKLEDIISNYLSTFNDQKDNSKDWRFYFIKYDEFRKNEDGFYYWKDMNSQYESIMMRRSTLGGFNWSPFLFTLKTKIGDVVTLDNYGNKLLLPINNATLVINNLNTGYKIEAYDEDSKDLFVKILEHNFINSNGICEIRQNTDGVDIEDRVQQGIDLISNIMAL